MIKTFIEVQRGHKEEIKKSSELAKILEKLKEESMDNGGEHLESITTDLCGLYCRIEQLAITMENNKSLGKDTSYTRRTLVDTIIESAVYMSKS